MNAAFHFLRAAAAALILATSAAGQAVNSSPNSTIEGIWRWEFRMPDGAVIRPKLRLAFKEGKLTGTSSYRPGSEVAITNVLLQNDQLRFQVVRERGGQDIITTYTGKWAGHRIQGKIESNWTGGREIYDWQAERLHGATGVWKWSTTFGERKIDVQATLKQDGAKVDGTIPRRGGDPTRIKSGSLKDDTISFDVDSGQGENRRTTKYRGKLSGDMITGTIESSFGGTARRSEWIAQRVD